MNPLDFIGHLAGGLQKTLGDWFTTPHVQGGNLVSPVPTPAATPKVSSMDQALLAAGYTKDAKGEYHKDLGKASTTAPKVNVPQATQAPAQQQQPKPIPNAPMPSSLTQRIPEGTGSATAFIKANTPGNGDLSQYYPALQNPQFVQELVDADKKRPGLANLLLLQSFFESTLGRGGNGYFGAKPQGQTANFQNPVDALHYQLGPSMLGGGANPNMNILGTDAPMTLGDVVKLYQSYNPEGDYLPQLLQGLSMGQ